MKIHLPRKVRLESLQLQVSQAFALTSSLNAKRLAENFIKHEKRLTYHFAHEI
jgi:hypothetical protein